MTEDGWTLTGFALRDKEINKAQRLFAEPYNVIGGVL
jgi:hypothetical protein